MVVVDNIKNVLIQGKFYRFSSLVGGFDSAVFLVEHGGKIAEIAIPTRKGSYENVSI